MLISSCAFFWHSISDSTLVFKFIFRCCSFHRFYQCSRLVFQRMVLFFCNRFFSKVKFEPLRHHTIIRTCVLHQLQNLSGAIAPMVLILTKLLATKFSDAMLLKAEHRFFDKKCIFSHLAEFFKFCHWH